MVVSFLGSARITSLFTHNVGNSIMIEPLSMRTECLIMFSPDARANEVKKGIPVYDLSLLPVRCDGASYGFVKGPVSEDDDAFSFFSPDSLSVVVENGKKEMLEGILGTIRIEESDDVEKDRSLYILSSLGLSLISLILDARISLLSHFQSFSRLFRMISSEFRLLSSYLGYQIVQKDIEWMLSHIVDHYDEMCVIAKEKYVLSSVISFASRHSVSTPYLNLLSVLLEARKDVVRFS